MAWKQIAQREQQGIMLSHRQPVTVLTVPHAAHLSGPALTVS